jgi:hypothetical protein
LYVRPTPVVVEWGLEREPTSDLVREGGVARSFILYDPKQKVNQLKIKLLIPPAVHGNKMNHSLQWKSG